MDKAKLSKKYQIVVPKEVRKKMGLRVGESVSVYSVDKERAMLVKHPKSYADALQGLGKEVWEALGGADKYIKEERGSWEKKSV
ncbi:MAG: AbrB/MazE/SpoVT family DNA-binding domain-containing protein [Candidatus Yanofskybacteria bacterium]|nr:AbrB/MazE/SpoVT family DNA-binding domain-containing protein [Candidatus Yanofskybacteria bacterium]